MKCRYLSQVMADRSHDLLHKKESKDPPNSFYPLLQVSEPSPLAEEHIFI